MSTRFECIYCTDEHKGFMKEIARLEASIVYLNYDQTYRGRCYVALNDHKTELFELEEGELSAYMRDVAKVAKAVQSAFNPDKINYAVYGDVHRHLHYHIVPKYMDGPAWGGAFELFGSKRLNDEELADMIALIRERLQHI